RLTTDPITLPDSTAATRPDCPPADRKVTRRVSTPFRSRMTSWYPWSADLGRLVASIFPSKSFTDLMAGLTTNQCSEPLAHAAMETKLGGFFELNRASGTCGVPKIKSTSPASKAVVDKFDCMEMISTSTPALLK